MVARDVILDWIEEELPFDNRRLEIEREGGQRQRNASQQCKSLRRHYEVGNENVRENEISTSKLGYVISERHRRNVNMLTCYLLDKTVQLQLQFK